MDQPEHLQAITAEELKEVSKRAMLAWFKNKEKPNDKEKSIFQQNISNIVNIFRVAKLYERYCRDELGKPLIFPILLVYHYVYLDNTL